MNEDFKLTIELVPSSLWWMNPRKSMKQSRWDTLRKQVYRQYNNVCGICGAMGVRLNCHERWDYSVVDGGGTQKLIGFIALCDLCHHVKHIGHAGILAQRGQLYFEQVVEHFMRVNQCTREAYEEHYHTAFAEWNERNTLPWDADWGEYQHLMSKEEG
jgi:hypothetical protein